MPLPTNRAAFLAMVRESEGTASALDPWGVTFGREFTVYDFSDHPHALGWPGFLWNGVRETAAGAYQIIYSTWVVLKARLNLPDFSAASQDAAAIELIREKGALPIIDEGDLETAIALCSGIWASLPGNPSGQPQASLQTLSQAYIQAGGVLA